MKHQVWSCGGGTQSGAIAALIADGRLPKPDICVMVDVTRERSSTWPFVQGFIRQQLAKASVDLTVIPAENFADLSPFDPKGTTLLPGFTNQSGITGKLSAFCSERWKRRVVMRHLRSLGIEQAENWIGISVDEMRRVRTPDRDWLQLRYPLIFDVPMRRHQCAELIRAHGWEGHIPHSSCWMCPNHSDAEWMEMKRDWPDDFRRAAEFEREIRRRDQHFYLHPSCIPLDQVDFGAQQSMFREHGCTGGCFT